MSEFLVMLRHRLGWPDVRSVLYADIRPQAHEKVIIWGLKFVFF